MGGSREGEEGERGKEAAPAICRGKVKSNHEVECIVCIQTFSVTVEESQRVYSDEGESVESTSNCDSDVHAYSDTSNGGRKNDRAGEGVSKTTRG